MKRLGRIGGIFLPIRNVKKMVGWDQFKESAQNVGVGAKEAFKFKKSPIIKETYEEAVRRLNLTQKDIENRKKNFFRTALFYLVIAAVLFVYAVDLLFSSMFFATLVAFMLVIIAGALAFREHFWYTQMKQQRLGLSFKDWFGYTFRGLK